MKKKFYITERHNPQLGIYYIQSGQLTEKEAKKREDTIYGHNVMLPYETEKEYNDAIEELRSKGERVQ